jgi:hypothetical protein
VLIGRRLLLLSGVEAAVQLGSGGLARGVARTGQSDLASEVEYRAVGLFPHRELVCVELERVPRHDDFGVVEAEDVEVFELFAGVPGSPIRGYRASTEQRRRFDFGFDLVDGTALLAGSAYGASGHQGAFRVSFMCFVCPTLRSFLQAPSLSAREVARPPMGLTGSPSSLSAVRAQL